MRVCVRRGCFGSPAGKNMLFSHKHMEILIFTNFSFHGRLFGNTASHLEWQQVVKSHVSHLPILSARPVEHSGKTALAMAPESSLSSLKQFRASQPRVTIDPSKAERVNDWTLFSLRVFPIPFPGAPKGPLANKTPQWLLVFRTLIFSLSSHLGSKFSQSPIANLTGNKWETVK